MPDIPDQPVARRIEQVVERNGQFDDAETGPEVSAGDGNGVDRLGPQLVGHLPELLLVEAAQVGGALDRVEDWSGYCHDCNNIVASTRRAE